VKTLKTSFSLQGEKILGITFSHGFMSDLQLVLRVHGPNAAQEEVFRHASQIKNLLEKNLDVQLVPESESIGRAITEGVEKKAEPITMAAIALAFVSGGAAKAVIDAIRALSGRARDSAFEYDITVDDKSAKISLKADHLTQTQATAFLEKLDTTAELLRKLRPPAAQD
jgi:hypothetical protein